MGLQHLEEVLLKAREGYQERIFHDMLEDSSITFLGQDQAWASGLRTQP